MYPVRAVAIVSPGDIWAGLLSRAENTPITERCEANVVPTGSVSRIIITDVGWGLMKD